MYSQWCRGRERRSLIAFSLAIRSGSAFSKHSLGINTRRCVLFTLVYIQTGQFITVASISFFFFLSLSLLWKIKRKQLKDKKSLNGRERILWDWCQLDWCHYLFFFLFSFDKQDSSMPAWLLYIFLQGNNNKKIKRRSDEYARESEQSSASSHTSVEWVVLIARRTVRSMKTFCKRFSLSLCLSLDCHYSFLCVTWWRWWWSAFFKKKINKTKDQISFVLQPSIVDYGNIHKNKMMTRGVTVFACW